MYRNKQRAGGNIRLVFFFVGFVVVLIILSGVIKTFSLLTKSKFDTKHRFTVLVVSSDSQSTLFSVSPDTKEISALKLTGLPNTGTVLDRLALVRKQLEVPIDGYVEEKYSLEDDTEDPSSIAPRVSKMLFSYPSIKTDLTIIDIGRLYFFAKSVPIHAVTVRSYEVANTDVSSGLAITTMDRVTAELFFDPAISSEKITVQVINGTDIAGLGTRIARLLTNIGADVVSVATSDTSQSHSLIKVLDSNTYTAKKVQQLFNFPVLQVEKKGIADVIIIFGADKTQSLLY
jgi:hypothetical protein